MKSKAIVFTGPKQVELTEISVETPGEKQVLIRTTVSLISTGTETFCYCGVFEDHTTWAGWVKYPFYPGYSSVGEVVETGKNALLKVGDRVFSNSSHREHQVRDEEAVVLIPETVSDQSAAWSALAFISQTAVRRAEHALGDTAVIIGLGPLGQLVNQYLRISGLGQILAIDTVPARLETAARFGATATFCGSAADAGPFVKDYLSGELADVVYDVTGHYSVLPLALPLARQFGKTVLLGDSPEPTRQHLTQDILARQVTLIGSHTAKLQPQYAHWNSGRQIELFLEYVRRGLFKTEELITHSRRPEKAPDVYQKLLDYRTDTLGVVFDWQEQEGTGS
jgi:2-desacetyl-2-hydroxyethyl bacteriochlorophyllide A dehydrogenase